MKERIQNIIKSVCRDLFHIEPDIELTHPDNVFGDFSSNVALKIAGQLKQPPMEIAEMVARIINNHKGDLIDKVVVASPGFLNIMLTSKALHDSYSNTEGWTKHYKDDQILVEFGDPNPFKEMHIGHLYSSIIGDSVAKLFEAGEADVKRLSYHGDVGLQVAKSIWGIGKSINWDLSKLKDALSDKPLGLYYSTGAKAYDSNETAAAEIKEINEHIYKKDDEKINRIYDEGKKVSFDQFNLILAQIEVKYDKQYLESESSEIGIDTVNKYLGEVFEESEGAVVYKGEKDGLHTRVFINSRGLPTYETKDLGLVELKNKDFPKAKKSIVITASEQTEYFKVMLAALKRINPKLAAITTHIPHGFLSLTSGKMSSRTGDVYAAEALLDSIKSAVTSQYPDSTTQNDIFLAAVRYTFLKQKLGADIVFDVKESVGLEGNSGPYIQYAHARARSILDKASKSNKNIPPDIKLGSVPLQASERHLAMKLSEFSETVERAISESLPHYICTYLYELSQEFNSFYEANRVLGDSRMFTRLDLVKIYADVLKAGMGILGIPSPDHM